MNLKEELNSLVNAVKSLYKSNGEKITIEIMAKRIGLSRSYFSALLGGSEEIKQKHIDDFKAYYKEELAGNFIPSQPGDWNNYNLAMLKMLYQRVAKSESERLGLPIKKVMDEMDAETKIAYQELEREK
jgi:hypothetical protein